MSRNGLTRPQVVEAAAKLVDERGAEGFSMRALADTLGVRTASLYNHVESMEALLAEVCAYGLRAQRDALLRATEGAEGADGIRRLSAAYRSFAGEHRRLYRLMIATAARCDESLGDTLQCIVEPFWRVLDGAGLTEAQKTHWQRVLRGLLHGFVSAEDAGFFAHLPEGADASFEVAVQCYIDGLEAFQGRELI